MKKQNPQVYYTPYQLKLPVDLEKNIEIFEKHRKMYHKGEEK